VTADARADELLQTVLAGLAELADAGDNGARADSEHARNVLPSDRRNLTESGSFATLRCSTVPAPKGNRSGDPHPPLGWPAKGRPTGMKLRTEIEHPALVGFWHGADLQGSRRSVRFGSVSRPREVGYGGQRCARSGNLARWPAQFEIE